MDKIPILFLYSSKGYGGLVQNISLIVQNLNPEQFQIYAIALQGASDSENELQLTDATDVVFEKIPDIGKLDFSCIKRVRQLLNQHEVQIVSCHGYKADVYGWILRYLLGAHVRLCTIAHGWIPSGIKMRFYYFLDKCVMRCFDRVILVSEGQRAQLGTWGVDTNRVSVIHNAVSEELANVVVNREEARAAISASDDQIVIGCVGRLSKEKAFTSAVSAIKELVERGLDVMLVIVGEGPERSSLESLAASLGERVIFTGFRRDLEQLYSSFDIFVSTSITEGLPNTLLEAQAFGLPCVVSDISGNNDIVRDGENGFLYPSGEIDVLVSKLTSLIEDPVSRQELGTQAKEVVSSRFSLSTRIARLEDEYRNLTRNS